MKNKYVPEFKIYTGSKSVKHGKPIYDLSKNWFIEYYDRIGQRQRIYKGINKHKTIDGRLLAAETKIKELQLNYKPRRKNITNIRKALYLFVEETGCTKTKSAVNKLYYFIDKNKFYELNHEGIQAFSRYMKRELSPVTHNHYIKLLTAAFRQLQLDTSMFEEVRRPKAISKPARYFTMSQIGELKNYIIENNPRLWLGCQLQYYCFLRPNEHRQLVASDFILDEQKIRVRGEISKNGKTEYIGIPDAFLPSLEFLKDYRPEQALFPSNWDKNKFLSKGRLREFHFKILKELGYSTEYKYYSWKHTGVVALVKADVSLKKLQIQLRHHSLQEVQLYTRQLGVEDLTDLKKRFPAL